MKVAVASKGREMENEVSEVFGRSPYFIFAEIEGKEIKKAEAIENESLEQRGGVGISAARLVAENGAEAVITGNIGPRAFSVLKQFDIEVYSKGKCKSVKEALEEFIDGRLERII